MQMRKVLTTYWKENFLISLSIMLEIPYFHIPKDMLKRTLFTLLSMFVLSLVQAQETNSPFKKGLWFTGLEGIISSSNNTLDTVSSGSFNTAYAFSISSKKLFSDRWAAGLKLSAKRSSSSGVFQRESESFFIGPSIVHFFSDAKDGSLFLEFTPGYVRFFEKSAATTSNNNFSQSIDGNGFGTSLVLGYAYVLNEQIVFSFGMNMTNFWITGDRVTEPAGTSIEENLTIGSLAFNFGFSVLLEKFFF